MTTFSYFEPLTEGHCTFWALEVLKRATIDPRISKVEIIASDALIERIRPVCIENGVITQTIPIEELRKMAHGNLISRARAQWKHAVEISERTSGQVFLPFFDHAAVAAALDARPFCAATRVSGVIFRPPNSYGMPKSFGRLADQTRRWGTYYLASRRTKALLTLDEMAPKSKLGRYTGALEPLVDPAPEFSRPSDPTYSPTDRDVWLIFGSLTSRKGIFQILEAWRLKDCHFHKKNTLKFAGKIGEAERDSFFETIAVIQKTRPEIMIETDDRFIGDDELEILVKEATVILAPYQNHIGSSGVLYWAAAAQRPVLAQNTGLMGFQVQHYGLGLSIDTTNPEVIARHLNEGISFDPNPEFISNHNLANFGKTIIDAVMR